MTTTINASTSAGLVQTADTSGNLSLQSGGTTILALTSAGAAVTGALSATTTLTVTGTTTLGASTERVQINRLSDGTSYGLITLNGLDASTTACGMYGRGSGGDSGKLFITGIGTVVSQIAGVTVTSVSSTGLTVTGQVTSSGATNDVAFIAQDSGAVTGFKANNTGTGGRNYSMFSTANASGLGGGLFAIYDNTAGAARLTISSTGAVVCSAGSGYTFKGAGASTSAMFSGQCANGTDFEWGPDIVSSSIYRVQNSGGTGVYLTSGNTAWTANSDERLKDIAGEFTGALDFIVSKVRTVRGTWKADETKRSRSFLLAQDWQDYLPEGIEVSADGILGLTKEDTIPVAFAAIKELAAMVKNLTTRLAALETK